MAWKKLDDELTDPTSQEPLSAFLARGLTRNVNGYAEGLTRTGAHAFDNSDVAMLWASYDQPTGWVFTFDVGTNARQVTFDIVGNTETSHSGGTFVVRHLDTSTQAFLTVPADQTLQLRSVVFDLIAPMSGPQGFFIGWQSDVGPDLGFVRVRGATENQIYVDQAPGAGHWVFPTAAGTGAEQHLMIRVDPVTTAGVMPSSEARRDYQICYFKHFVGNNPDGTFVVWPEVDQSPAFLPNRYDANLQVVGHVYELGAFQLWSVTGRVTAWLDGVLGLPNAYDQTTTLNGIASATSGLLTPLMPSLASVTNEPGRFGRILRVGETLYFTFAVQNKAPFGVQVNFRAFSINPEQANFSQPDLTFDVLDNTGTPVGTQTVLSKVSVPRMVPQPGYRATGTSMIAANGVYADRDGWGMRDAMPVYETMATARVVMRWENPGNFNAVQVGGGDVYTGAITCTSDIYVHAFFAQVF